MNSLDAFLADLAARCSPPPASRLVVFTAPLTYRGPDALNVTRKTGGPAGLPFAPSWDIVRPVTASRHADEHTQAEAWERYVPLYCAEMERSYARDPGPWHVLLARERVVLACYCAVPARSGAPLRCHRVLLAGILQRLGPHLGCAVEVRGEVGEAEPLHGGGDRAHVAAACAVPVTWVPEHHAVLTEDELVDEIERRAKAERALARSPLWALAEERHREATGTDAPALEEAREQREIVHFARHGTRPTRG
jgi:hypothetical protein